MTYSPKLASAFTDTSLRSRHVSPQSGMCSLCTEECDGTCEIALAAVLGARTVYPTTTGQNQVGSEKDYPIDFSHFNINGRVFGAQGVNPTYEEATIYNVNLESEFGKTNKVKLALPLLLPALIKLNWQDYFAGAAMAGVVAVLGENARLVDPELKIKDGRIVDFPALTKMFEPFRKYDRGYGQMVLQVNVEDDMLKLPEYAIEKDGIKALEFKFGQSAKGTQPAIKMESMEEALKMKAAGIPIYPDPSDPEVVKAYEEGVCPNMYLYSRLPLWDEDYLTARIDELREMGYENFYFKMAGYDPADLERVLELGSQAQVDMITFDGAGGGSGYSPCKMMNEFGLPTIVMEDTICRLADKMRAQGKYIPAITITGGMASEDQVFKSLAYSNGHVNAVGLCRASMTAAMTGKKVGQLIKEDKVPRSMRRFGNSVEELYGDLADLRAIYGKKANDFPLGAVGVFSYLNKIGFGLKHFAALNRKFDISYLDRSDLHPLTSNAKDLVKGKWFDYLD